MADVKAHTEQLRSARGWTLVMGGLGLGMSFWFLDSVVDAFIFLDGNLVQQLFAPAPIEIWMRLLVLSFFFAFGLYAQFTLTQRKGMEEQLRRAQADMEMRIAERTASLAESNTQLEGEIAERKRAETALLESERLLRLVTDALPVFISYIDRDQRYRFNNKAYEQWFGVSRESIKGCHMSEVLGEEAYRTVQKYVERALTGEQVSYETLMPFKGDRPRYINATYVPHFGEHGEQKGFFVLVTDVTERKQVERELLELNVSLQNALEGISRLDARGLYIAVNRAYGDMLGYMPEELIGASWEPTVHDEDREVVRAAYERMLLHGKGEFEARAIRKDGSIFYKHVVMVKACNEEGSFVGHHCFMKDITRRKEVEEALRRAHDELEARVVRRTAKLEATNKQLEAEITERKRLEEALRKSEANYHDLYEHAPDMFASVDAATAKIIQCNQTLSAALGYSKEEIIGSPIFNVYHADCLQAVEENFHSFVTTGQVGNRELQLKRKDGSKIDVSLNVSALRDEQGRIISSRTIWRDIRERKQAEEQIKAALTDKEVLLKEIHHRVKNNLQIISSLLSLQSRVLPGSKEQDLFMDSRHRIQVMALIHEHLYRSQDLANVPFADYAHTLARTLIQSQGANPDLITLKLQITDVMLDIDIALLCGLILNELLTNALKHAFPGGRRGEVRIQLSSEPERYLLRVSDNGVGLPRGMDIQRADTLGLRLVRALATQLRGTVERGDGEGTIFTISFPVTQEVQKGATYELSTDFDR